MAALGRRSTESDEGGPMAQHVKIVAILSIILGVGMALIGVVIFVIVAGAGAASGEREAMWVTGIVGTMIGGICIVLALPAIIGGLGLLKQREWARILIIIVAALSLLNFPFGTAYGVYAIYVLLHDQARPLFT
jgi:O-antigen/teichoic acid export membrane protein